MNLAKIFVSRCRGEMLQVQRKYDEALKHYESAAKLLRVTTTPSYIDDLSAAKMSIERQGPGFKNDNNVIRAWQEATGHGSRSSKDKSPATGKIEEHRIVQGYDFPVLSGELAVVLTRMSWIQFHGFNGQINGTLVEEAAQLHATGHHKAIVQYWLGMICVEKAKREAGGAAKIWFRAGTPSTSKDAKTDECKPASRASPEPAATAPLSPEHAATENARTGRAGRVVRRPSRFDDAQTPAKTKKPAATTFSSATEDCILREGNLESLKVAVLREELKLRGLPTKGRKAELVERLTTYFAEGQHDVPSSEKAEEPHHVGLFDPATPNNEDLANLPVIAKARKHLMASFQLCKRMADPTILRNVCILLASLQGDHDPLQTAYYLHVGLGVSARQEMAIRHCKLQDEQPLTSSLVDAPPVAQLYSFTTTSSGQDFDKEYLQNLPENLTVCSVSYQKTENALLITRVSKSSAVAPLVQRVPLAQIAPWSPVAGTTDTRCALQLALEELEAIITGSDDVIDTSKGIIETEDKEEKQKMMDEWWNSRKQLDRRMGELVEKLENAILGPWKTMLVGQHQNPATQQALSTEASLYAMEVCTAIRPIIGVDFEVNVAKCERLLDGLASGCMSDEQQDLLLDDICGRQFLEANSEIKESLSMLLEARVKALAELMTNDTLDEKETSHTPPVFSLPETPRKTPHKAQHGGNRAFSHQPKGKRTSHSAPARQSLHCHAISHIRQPVCLILDQDLRGLPWESLPILSRHPVCRMPSIAFVSDGAARGAAKQKEMGNGYTQTAAEDHAVCQTLDEDKTYYVLNPSKDLKTTQLKFEKAFRGRKHWTGVVGEAPPVEDFKRALSSCDTVVYCGHGAGQNFLNASQLDGTECSAAMLLMGCSSGRLRSGGDFEPSGMALKYLIAGAPAVVANLWDVTDKDTDIVTDTILEVS